MNKSNSIIYDSIILATLIMNLIYQISLILKPLRDKIDFVSLRDINSVF